MSRLGCISLLVLSLVLMSWGEGHATTWVVAKDGSGDYSVIQDALDVCAAGDTVRIKSGRYDELRVHNFQSGGTAAVAMTPAVAPLTVIGTDKDSVLVGPSTLMTSYQGYQTSILTPDGIASERIVISGITMENAEWLATLRSPHTFSHCRFGVVPQAGIGLSNAPDVVVEDCLFDGGEMRSGNGILSFVGGNNPGLQVTNCIFRDIGTAIQITGSQGFVFSQLTFEGVAEAFSIQYGSRGTITDCQIGASTFPVARITLIAGSQVTMDHVSVISETGAISLDDDDTSLTGSDLHLEGGSYATVYVATGASLTLHDCDILNGGGSSLFAHDLLESGGNVDVRQCYWGTTDSLQVEQWIVDGKDDTGYKNVLFWPIRETPVPVKAESFGGLKALFRGGH